MSQFIIYGNPASPFLRSVAMALEEKGEPYRIQTFGPGGIGSEAHRKVHPFARIPAIDDGGYQLYETQAILRYIDAKFPNPPLQPAQPEAIGRMNQLIGINDWYLFPQVARTIVGERIMRPAFMGTTPDEAAIAGAVPAAEHCLNELDRLLGDQPFLAGSQLSLADLLLAPQIDLLDATPEGNAILRETALLRRLARMNARASMQATVPPAELRLSVSPR
jgi:glutathione S-transferase